MLLSMARQMHSHLRFATPFHLATDGHYGKQPRFKVVGLLEGHDMLIYWSSFFLVVVIISIGLGISQVIGTTVPAAVGLLSFAFFAVTSLALITGQWGARQRHIDDDTSVEDESHRRVSQS